MVHPSTRLEPNSGSDKSWVFSTFDFADEELKEHTFAIRFKTPELASEFKDAYESAGRHNDSVAEGKAEAPEEKQAAGGGGAGDEGFPTVTDIKFIYGEGPALQPACERFAACAQAFVAKFEAAPDVFVRAPGRVNLIGEHIDYMGYGVLPMALSNDVLIASRATPADQGVQVANVKSDEFTAIDLPADPSAEVNTADAHWSRYFHAAYKGVYDALGARNDAQTPTPTGLQAMVSGTVPCGAGVSSSSAFVVASFLSTALAANSLDSFTKTQAADACRQCEGYVGTMGGGMDQAASCLATAGQALYITFNPLTTTPVTLPQGGTFVVCNSLTPSHKAASASTYYNKRVVECKLGVALLAKSLGIDSVPATFKALETASGKSSSELAASAGDSLKEGEYTVAELESELGSLGDLLGGDSRADAVLSEAASAGSGFALRARALHVLSEAARVVEFRALCDAGGEPQATLASLGELMNASQASCRDDYECSCPELDTLTQACRDAGALGARLTGAGWGGCAVALVRDEDVDSFIEAVSGAFYADNALAVEPVSTYLFATKPGNGAAVYRMAQ